MRLFTVTAILIRLLFNSRQLFLCMPLYRRQIVNKARQVRDATRSIAHCAWRVILTRTSSKLTSIEFVRYMRAVGLLARTELHARMSRVSRSPNFRPRSDHNSAARQHSFTLNDRAWSVRGCIWDYGCSQKLELGCILRRERPKIEAEDGEGV